MKKVERSELLNDMNFYSFQNHVMAFLLAIVILAGCSEDVTTNDNGDPDLVNPVVAIENDRLDEILSEVTITGFLKGYVLDELGNPLANVSVETGSYSVSTNSNGYFSFGEIEMNSKYAFVQAMKSGFFNGSRTFTPRAYSINTINIQLLNKNSPQTISSESGGQLAFESGTIKLDFPPNVLVYPNGTSFTGDAKVYARYMDPDAGNFIDVMPGSLAGLTYDDEVLGLVSSGMITVEMEDNSGNALQIAKDNLVKVTMPAEVDDPANIPIWHFNETYGLWVEAGTATKTGSTYEFDANYFSAWNLDVIGGGQSVSVILQTEGNSPGEVIYLGNQRVDIYTEDCSDIVFSVYTDHAGVFDLVNAPQNLCLKIILNPEEEESCVTKYINTVEPVATVIIDDNDYSCSGTQLYSINGLLNDCDVPFSEKFYILEGIYDPSMSFSGISDYLGNYRITGIYPGLNTNVDYAFLAGVYINISEAKFDTIFINFSENEQSLNLDFCGRDVTNLLFNPNLTYGEVTDIDGNIYKTIDIGTQTWMAQNLRTTRYNDGALISTDSFSYYNDDPADVDVYGILYEYGPIISGKICPEGWHVPQQDEWESMVEYLGGEESIVAVKLSSKSPAWSPAYQQFLENTNSSGFSAIPNGYRNIDDEFEDRGLSAYIWAPSPSWSTVFRLTPPNSAYVSSGFFGDNHFSCRCVED